MERVEAREQLPRLVPVAMAATYIGVTRHAVSKWIKAGLLPAIPAGNQRLIPREHIHQMIRDRAQNGGRKPRVDKGTRHAATAR